MDIIVPKKLQKSDEIRVIAPSHSLGIISGDIRLRATSLLEGLGLKVTFGKNVEELDEYTSSSIQSRINDLEEAFLDKNVKAIFAVIGGYNSNQLLPYINWDLIQANPKIFIGYSDTTTLQNAMYAKTGLITYSGPAYSTLGQHSHLDYTVDYLKRCLFADDSFAVVASTEWLDDEWYLNENPRSPMANSGFIVLREGKAEGTLVGGNLSTFHLLQGTDFLPSLEQSILFLEDDEDASYADFDRLLESLSQISTFEKVQGLLIGRFQKKSEMSIERIRRLLTIREKRFQFPIIANMDFGHTNPMITLPIGGEASVDASSKDAIITITKH